MHPSTSRRSLTSIILGHAELLDLMATLGGDDDGRETLTVLLDRFERHTCAAPDLEGVAELESMIDAWSALNHPVAIRSEIAALVDSHVEDVESTLSGQICSNDQPGEAELTVINQDLSATDAGPVGPRGSSNSSG